MRMDEFIARELIHSLLPTGAELGGISRDLLLATDLHVSENKRADIISENPGLG